MKIIVAAVLLMAGLLDWLVFQGEHLRWLALGAAILIVVTAAATWLRLRRGTNA
jgi:hypothetical protein